MTMHLYPEFARKNSSPWRKKDIILQVWAQCKTTAKLFLTSFEPLSLRNNNGFLPNFLKKNQLSRPAMVQRLPQLHQLLFWVLLTSKDFSRIRTVE